MQNLGSRSVVVGLVVGLTAAAGAPARADDIVAGTYKVKFEEVANNCGDRKLTYDGRAFKIVTKGGDVEVDVERTPLMVGKTSKSGKLSAKSPRAGHTSMEGMDGVFSIAGRITSEGMLSLVMVGEYQTAGKPLCTQSWNLSGLRSGAERSDKPAAPDKPEKKR